LIQLNIMKNKCIQVNAPNDWRFVSLDLPQDDGELVQVHYSSLCHTDCQIIDGTLSYYRDKIADYPIIPGHEWCGVLDGQPVVGTCISGCGHCKMCCSNREMCCCDRLEVGVIRKNGGFSEYIWIPRDSLVNIPELDPRYALVEPLAVAIHGIHRLRKPLSSYNGIVINGIGTIGKFCLEICKSQGLNPSVRDPRLMLDATPSDYELLIECSGNSCSLDHIGTTRGQTLLAFGFAYNRIEPGILVANELDFIGALGSSKKDFVEAIEILPDILIPDFELLSLADFNIGLKLIKKSCKSVFKHEDL